MPVSLFPPKEQTEGVDKLIETNTEKKKKKGFVKKTSTKTVQASTYVHIKSMAHFQLNTAKL